MKQIAKLYAEWQSLQPVSKEIQDKIDRKFMLEFNYNSNHIEGNTLTYGQTELLLMFGQVDGDAKMHDLEEMKAHNVGLKMMQEEAHSTERPLSEYFIKNLHKTLIREDYNVRKEINGEILTYTVHAGQYKTRPNSVITATGERFEYASPEETPALMTDLVDWYNSEVAEKKLSALELASLFHYRYIRIHPFEDGNGRIARLLVNFILLRAGYPMIVVRTKDKDKYLSALNRSDIIVGLTPSEGAHAELEQIQPFVEYIKGCLERALDIRIRAAKGESIEEKDDWKKSLKLHHADKINRPELTEETKSQLLEVKFPEMLRYIDSELAPYYSIFTRAGWSSEVGTFDCERNEFNIPDNENYCAQLRFYYQFQNGYNDEHIVDIYLRTQQFQYVVDVRISFFNFPDRRAYEKVFSYNQTMEEDVYDEITNIIGRHMNAVIKHNEGK